MYISKIRTLNAKWKKENCLTLSKPIPSEIALGLFNGALLYLRNEEEKEREKPKRFAEHYDNLFHALLDLLMLKV